MKETRGGCSYFLDGGFAAFLGSLQTKGGGGGVRCGDGSFDHFLLDPGLAASRPTKGPTMLT